MEAGTRSGGASSPGPHHTGEKTSPTVHHQIQGRQVSNTYETFAFINVSSRDAYSDLYYFWNLD